MSNKNKFFVIGALPDIENVDISLNAAFRKIRKEKPEKGDTIIMLGSYYGKGSSAHVLTSIMSESEYYSKKNKGAVNFVALKASAEYLAVTSPAKEQESGMFGKILNSYKYTIQTAKDAVNFPKYFSHLTWLANRPFFYETDNLFFTPQSVDPALELSKTPRGKLLQQNEEFLKSKKNYGKIVVHGNNPLDSLKVKIKPNRINVDVNRVDERVHYTVLSNTGEVLALV
jgi:serine/threonine protein phosphatase 1